MESLRNHNQAHQIRELPHYRSLSLRLAFSESAWHPKLQNKSDTNGVDEVRVLQVYDAWSLGVWFPTLQDSGPILKGENVQEECNFAWTFRPLKMGPPRCLKTSWTKYPATHCHCKKNEHLFLHLFGMSQWRCSLYILRRSGSSHTTEREAEFESVIAGMLSIFVCCCHVSLTHCTFRYMLVSWYSVFKLIILGNNCFAMCSMRSKKVHHFSWQLHAGIPEMYSKGRIMDSLFFPVLMTDRRGERKGTRNYFNQEIHRERQERTNKN